MQDEWLFEWDEAKSAANLRKHGISFEQARSMWDDPYMAEVHLQSWPEDRWAVMAHVEPWGHLTAIVTYRGESVRIISVRKSSKREAEAYERH